MELLYQQNADNNNLADRKEVGLLDTPQYNINANMDQT